MSDWQARIAHDARLIILRELARQVDGRLNAVSIRRVLDAYSIARSAEWIETQLIAMAELEAVTVMRAGEIAIAAITDRGRDHVEERIIIAGISRPSDLRG